MQFQYPNSSAADVRALLQKVPVATKNKIIQALEANGLLTKTSHIGVVVNTDPAPYTFVNANEDQLAILSPNVNTQINSNGPVAVALGGGTNYLNINHHNTAKDRADTVVGGSGRDTIVGNTAAADLVAGSGKEYIASGGGRDTIRGGSGPNTLTGGGQSLIVAGSGRTTIVAGQSILGGTPQDTVQAGSGKDSITLVSGNNMVYAPTGGGSATINAGSGSDTVNGPTAFQGAETVNSGGHTTLQLGSGAVAYNLTAKSVDTVFGGQSAAFLNLNKAMTDITGAALASVGGQSGIVYTFAGGGSITVVGNVNLTFTNTRHTS
ncbi:calcium-binding protein [Lichenibacterium dinghuense]|uniref:calcium-binding protein n=1 Tax=Lichenibacterium dinghuense TaxID=2895977 RepID=UPI001F45955F|nr:hypothetical protein [Lichenibacterium sp. 6Y81]